MTRRAAQVAQRTRIPLDCDHLGRFAEQLDECFAERAAAGTKVRPDRTLPGRYCGADQLDRFGAGQSRYSRRSMLIGSTRAARRAGIHVASAATVTSTMVTSPAIGMMSLLIFCPSASVIIRRSSALRLMP